MASLAGGKLVAICLVLLFGCQSVLAAGPNKSAKKLLSGWQLKQRSNIYGLTHVFICNEDIRITREQDDLVVIAKPPAWDVFSFKKSSKKIYQKDLKGFGTDALFKAASVDATGIREIRDPSPGFHTFQTRTFLCINPKLKTKASAVLVTVSGLKVPKQAAALMAKFYNVPEADDPPIKLKSTAAGTIQQPNLETLDIRKDSKEANCLDVPTDYKSVDNIRYLIINVESNKDINEFVKQMLD